MTQTWGQGLPQLLPTTNWRPQAWANCPKLLTLPSDSKRFSMALISFTWDFFRNLETETLVMELLGSFINSHLFAYRTGESKTSLTSTPSCEFSRQNDSPCPQSSNYRSFLGPGSLQWICFFDCWRLRAKTSKNQHPLQRQSNYWIFKGIIAPTQLKTMPLGPWCGRSWPCVLLKSTRIRTFMHPS